MIKDLYFFFFFNLNTITETLTVDQREIGKELQGIVNLSDVEFKQYLHSVMKDTKFKSEFQDLVVM